MDIDAQKEFLTKYYTLVREKAIEDNWAVLPKGPLSPKKPVVEEKVEEKPVQEPPKASKQWGGSQDMAQKNKKEQPPPVVEPPPKVKVKGKWFQ